MTRTMLHGWSLIALALGVIMLTGCSGSSAPQVSIFDHFERGNQRMQDSRYKQAVGEYKAALALDFEHAVIHNNLGLAYYHLNLNKDASESFQEAIRLDPTYADANYNLALVLYRLKRSHEAMQAMQAYRKSRIGRSPLVKGGLSLRPGEKDQHSNSKPKARAKPKLLSQPYPRSAPTAARR